MNEPVICNSMYLEEIFPVLCFSSKGGLISIYIAHRQWQFLFAFVCFRNDYIIDSVFRAMSLGVCICFITQLKQKRSLDIRMTILPEAERF